MHVRRPASKRRRSGTLVRSKTRDRGGIGLMIAEQRSVWRVPLGGRYSITVRVSQDVVSYNDICSIISTLKRDCVHTSVQ
jgi:hypothetical protein